MFCFSSEHSSTTWKWEFIIVFQIYYNCGFFPLFLWPGETGAGKSSLLNLLLGDLADELLPVAHLSSTSVICELRYGPCKRMRAYSRDSSLPVKEEDLSGDSRQILSRYIHQKEDRTSASFEHVRVEILWPCDWLKGGIVIVDSPGVGENEELTDMVKQYIPHASGLIYVINTPNAGGIDSDRVRRGKLATNITILSIVSLLIYVLLHYNCSFKI